MNSSSLLVSGRIDRARLAAARFPAIMELPVRFDELDIYSHVNNAAAIAMLQEARISFYREMALPPTGPDYRTVVGAMTAEFADEITYPGKVEIHSGVSRLGQSSYTFAQVLRQDGEPSVFSLVTMVVTGEAGAKPIPEPLRTVLSRDCQVQFVGEG